MGFLKNRIKEIDKGFKKNFLQKKMKSRIYYSKPSITAKEVDYAKDAAKNGWERIAMITLIDLKIYLKNI